MCVEAGPPVRVRGAATGTRAPHLPRGDRGSRLPRFLPVLSGQAKPHRRDGPAVVDFKGASGVMVPTVICKGHGAASKRQLFDLCDATDAGEVCLPHLVLHSRQIM